jgi:hypothetical protein
MVRRHLLLILLTSLVLLVCAYGSISTFSTPYGLPFLAKVVDSHTVAIVPITGVSLPRGIQAGDRIDLPAMDVRSRIATWPTLGKPPFPPAGQTYTMVILRHGQPVTVPVATVSRNTTPGLRDASLLRAGIRFFAYLVLAGIALLLLWRGHGRAAGGMALWAISFMAGVAGLNMPINGIVGLCIQMSAYSFFLLARIGLYIMVESMVGSALSSRMRMLWRWTFILILLAGGITGQLGGPFLFATLGWTGWVRLPYEIILTLSYLVPVAMLFASYRSVAVEQRLRMRWMLWSGTIWVFGVLVSDTLFLGFTLSFVADYLAVLLAMLGFLYAILRHRVVDVSVAIDRTLVYASVTALVVGILAAVNNLIQHAALGTNASLLLQVIVPLALGIVLSRIRVYAERIMDQVFFRKKYLAKKALRRFARHCGNYEQANQLFKASIIEIRKHLGARGCAIFERKGAGYFCVHQEGEVAYPESAGIDDPAFVAARSEHKETDLADMQSILGTDGYVFPITALDELQGVLVTANRPGEHYAADERKLLTYVAHQMGLALYALHMRARDKFLDALANGLIQVSPEIQAKARELTLAVSPG